MDYANTFLEAPNPIKVPIYVILVSTCMILLLIGLVSYPVMFSILLIGYPFYSILLSWYFKIHIEKLDFLYPYGQNFTELGERLNVLLLIEGAKFIEVESCRMRMKIKKREYIIHMDVEKQTVQIIADWSGRAPGLRQLRYMLGDAGKIIYWLQHVYDW